LLSEIYNIFLASAAIVSLHDQSYGYINNIYLKITCVSVTLSLQLIKEAAESSMLLIKSRLFFGISLVAIYVHHL